MKRPLQSSYAGETASGRIDAAPVARSGPRKRLVSRNGARTLVANVA
jgi:hypothetical protein